MRDEHGNPVPIPGTAPESDDERQRREDEQRREEQEGEPGRVEQDPSTSSPKWPDTDTSGT